MAETNPKPQVVEIHQHATSNLRFIRETMERSSTFTNVPGWGGVGMGLAALAACITCTNVEDKHLWLPIWLACGMLSVGIGSMAVLEKSRRSNVPVDSPGARKFALSFLPPLLVGALITICLLDLSLHTPIPGVLLLMYGTAVLAGGAFSVRVVPLMGVCFQICGAIALFLPLWWGNILMGVGFGLVHIVFGAWIARRHGG